MYPRGVPAYYTAAQPGAAPYTASSAWGVDGTTFHYSPAVAMPAAVVPDSARVGMDRCPVALARRASKELVSCVDEGSKA